MVRNPLRALHLTPTLANAHSYRSLDAHTLMGAAKLCTDTGMMSSGLPNPSQLFCLASKKSLQQILIIQTYGNLEVQRHSTHFDGSQEVVHGHDIFGVHHAIVERALQRCNDCAVIVLRHARLTAVIVPENAPFFRVTDLKKKSFPSNWWLKNPETRWDWRERKHIEPLQQHECTLR